MKKKDLLSRITFDRKILMGKPTIRGLRISVEQILKALANGVAIEDLLKDALFTDKNVKYKQRIDFPDKVRLNFKQEDIDNTGYTKMLWDKGIKDRKFFLWRKFRK